jgi:hypothetical protein
MTNLSDAQAALAAANVVLADLNALRDTLQKAQVSAVPISPEIMTAARAAIVDVTAAVAAVQTVVTDLGG